MVCLQIKEAKRGKFVKCGNIDIEWGVEDPEDSEGLYCTPEEFGHNRVRACIYALQRMLHNVCSQETGIFSSCLVLLCKGRGPPVILWVVQPVLLVTRR